MSVIADPKARWREVPGTILRSEVRFDWEDYRPVVEYQYEVDGVSYRGDTIVVGPLITFNWKGPATRLIERFPVGTAVTVYVDPANPRRASLADVPSRGVRGSSDLVFGSELVAR
jgi:hypothetical protein